MPWHSLKHKNKLPNPVPLEVNLTVQVALLLLARLRVVPAVEDLGAVQSTKEMLEVTHRVQHLRSGTLFVDVIVLLREMHLWIEIGDDKMIRDRNRDVEEILLLLLPVDVIEIIAKRLIQDYIRWNLHMKHGWHNSPRENVHPVDTKEEEEL